MTTRGEHQLGTGDCCARRDLTWADPENVVKSYEELLLLQVAGRVEIATIDKALLDIRAIHIAVGARRPGGIRANEKIERAAIATHPLLEGDRLFGRGGK